MGRRSGGGGGSFRPRVATPPPKPASKPSSPAPAATQNNSNGLISVLGSVASNITEGISWGFGTSIGHRVAEFFSGPRAIRVISEETTAAAAASPAASLDASCGIHHKAFADCIGQNGSDISRCQFYIDLLNECRRGNDAATVNEG